MVYFQRQKSQLNFRVSYNEKSWNIYVHLVCFMAIWYIWYIWTICICGQIVHTMKNLATLPATYGGRCYDFEI
jgi:hypothetical protein